MATATPEEFMDVLKGIDATDYIKMIAPQGNDGSDGSSVVLKGTLANEAAIRAVVGATAGDVYMADDTGHGWVADGGTPTAWDDFGMLRGPSGTGGTPVTITNMNDITDTGTFDGTDVVGAPIKGKVLISAIKDTSGDIQYDVYSADGHLRLGGKPAHGHLQWDPVIPLVFKGNKFPDDKIGIDGDVYIEEGTSTTATDEYKPTIKTGDTYISIDATVPANVVKHEEDFLGKLEVAANAKKPSGFEMRMYKKPKPAGTKPVAGMPILLTINGIEFSMADLDLNTTMTKGYYTFSVISHGVEEAILDTLKVANTGNVVLTYFDHGADVYRKIKDIWFKDVSDMDVGQALLDLQTAIVVKATQTIKTLAPAFPKVDGKYELKVHNHKATWEKQNLERPEVVSPYTATPTKAELEAAFKKLPDYVAGNAAHKAAFWKGSHDFYVKDDPQTKMLLVKYRGVATSTEAAPGNFFFEKLTVAA